MTPLRSVFLAVIVLASCSHIRAAETSVYEQAPDPIEASLQLVRTARAGYGGSQDTSSPDVFFEDGLNEAEVVYLALSRHPDIRAADARRNAIVGDLEGARLYPNPQFEAGFEEGEPGGNLGGAEFNFALSQQILTGGRFGKRIRAAKGSTKAASWSYFEAGALLAAEARRGFFRVLATKELERITSDQVSLAKELLSIVERRLEAGATTLSEKLRAESFLASVRTKETRARATLEVAEANLRGLLIDVPAETPWSGHLPSIRIPDEVEAVLNVLEKTSPTLRRLAMELAVAEARVSVAIAGRRPNLTVGLGVRRNRAIDDTSYMATIGAPLPVSNRNQGMILRTRAEVVEAKALLESAQYRLRATARGLLSQLTRTKEQILAFREVVIPKAREALDLSRTGYQQGKFPYINVLDTQRELASALQQELQLRLEYALIQIRLDTALGYPLAPITGESR